MDISGSVEGNYDKEVSFMMEVIKGLSYDFRRTRTALVKFAGEANVSELTL